MACAKVVSSKRDSSMAPRWRRFAEKSTDWPLGPVAPIAANGGVAIVDYNQAPPQTVALEEQRDEITSGVARHRG